MKGKKKYDRMRVTFYLGTKENLFISITGEVPLVKAFAKIIQDNGGKNLAVSDWRSIK